MKLERSFEKLIGRQPTEHEVQRLYRIKETLGLRDNDALWSVLIALESYDALYRKYPQMITDQVMESTRLQRVAIAEMADSEAKRAMGALAEAVGRTSEVVALQAVKSAGLQWCGIAAIGMISFGALCVTIGFILGSGRIPYWAPAGQHENLAVLLFSTLARTPAGWLGACVGLWFSVGSLLHVRGVDGLRRQPGLILRCGALLTLAAAFCWPIF